MLLIAGSSLAILTGAAWVASAQSVATTSGDPARGREIVTDRTRGLCLLCHSGPFPEIPLQGDLAPSLAGAGARLDASELRLRITDSRRVNPETIMPPYGSTDGLVRVGERWRGTPILDPQEIEDVVAYLLTLTEEEQ
jgi:sulfur-oxidizing protein SoxX